MRDEREMLAGATNQEVGTVLAGAEGVADEHIDDHGAAVGEPIGRSRPVVVRLEARRDVISRG